MRTNSSHWRKQISAATILVAGRIGRNARLTVVLLLLLLLGMVLGHTAQRGALVRVRIDERWRIVVVLQCVLVVRVRFLVLDQLARVLLLAGAAQLLLLLLKQTVAVSGSVRSLECALPTGGGRFLLVVPTTSRRVDGTGGRGTPQAHRGAQLLRADVLYRLHAGRARLLGAQYVRLLFDALLERVGDDVLLLSHAHLERCRYGDVHACCERE